MSLSIVIPSYGGGLNIERTINSVAGICDDVVIISTAIFDEDKVHFRHVANSVVELPWNYVFVHGYGSMMNMGTVTAKNDWLMLLGVSETFAAAHKGVHQALAGAPRNTVFRCNHVNDPCQWKRVWNRTGGTQWAGIIHEEIVGGREGGLLFRMQDTDKTRRGDPMQEEAMKFIKTLSYNHLYSELLVRPERLGGASPEWLKFVAGAKESINAFVAEHREMIDTCLAGDLKAFLKLVESRVSRNKPADGVLFKPQGT